MTSEVDGAKPKGPRFVRFFWPILESLREAGGTAKPRDVVDRVVEIVSVNDDERAERTKSGSLRVENQIHWARNYLVWAGLMDGSQRGRWTLSRDGWAASAAVQTHEAAYALFKRVRAEHTDQWGQHPSDASSADDADSSDIDTVPAPLDDNDRAETELSSQLRSAVLALTPNGFENLCKRILTELGLVQLRVIGQAGDRGIDIEGHLRVSSVISFRVGVQCKRYGEGNKVTPNLIREFQGALGPFDRGIYVTSGVFTQQAEQQATSPGYKPIDLIDGERLIDLLIEHGVGTRGVTIVDAALFESFGVGDRSVLAG